VAELIWLNYLVRLSVSRTQYAYRIFTCCLRNITLGQSDEVFNIRLLLFRFISEPSRTAYGHISAWIKENHHIPTIIEMIKNIILNMLSWYLSRK